jgi:hypothetical protein
MPPDDFPPCRHRGAPAAAGVHRCLSPKLVGLKLVTAELCRDCYCRDHPGRPARTPLPRLAGCAHLGPAAGRRGGEAVHACLHPGHEEATERGCRACPDYLFPALSPRTPVGEVRRHFALPPRPQAAGWWGWPNVQEAQRQEAAAHLDRPPARPRSRGRGVVIAGGGRYAASAYVTARVLRHVGCTLPVELWHFAGEIDAGMRRLLRPLGVRCVDADAVARRRPSRFVGGWWKGWQLKPYAVAHSRFREVLFLDADCYPARDPSFLFDWPAYQEAGAAFWPDLPSSGGLFPPHLWSVFGVAPADCPPFESGQWLVDKGRCWRELSLALHYNAQADYTYRLVWGDKDTFLLAWRRLGRAYAMTPAPSGWDVHTIIQHDGQGRPLFLHRCRDKWRLGPAAFDSSPQNFAANTPNPRLPHEDFCFACLEELRAAWPAAGGGTAGRRTEVGALANGRTPL